MFPIDIMSIVFNLLINSVESFSHSTDDSRKIEISLSTKDEFVFDYSDNGAGLSNKFSDPYDIFKFGTTSKYDVSGETVGTGMGMYIVNTTLREYDSKPAITKVKNGFDIQFRLHK